jgi:hypothetical protein
MSVEFDLAFDLSQVPLERSAGLLKNEHKSQPQTYMRIMCVWIQGVTNARRTTANIISYNLHAWRNRL